MNDFPTVTAVSSVSITTEHGPLHGQLALIPNALGIVVLPHAGKALDVRDEVMAGILRHAGFSTFNVDLVSMQEEHFPDVHYNVPLLARRLTEFIGNIKHRMVFDEIPTQPIGICAANDTTPAAIRVAALRDHDIAALVCRGGLIDLAGVLYLRSLESPLLLMIEETDAQHMAANRRALQEVSGVKTLKLIPEIGFDFAASEGFEVSARETVQWFTKHLPPLTKPSAQWP